MEYFYIDLGLFIYLLFIVKRLFARTEQLKDTMTQLHQAQLSTLPDREVEVDEKLMRRWQERLAELPTDSVKWKLYRDALDKVGR